MNRLTKAKSCFGLKPTNQPRQQTREDNLRLIHEAEQLRYSQQILPIVSVNRFSMEVA